MAGHQRRFYAEAATRFADWIVALEGQEKAIEYVCAYVADPEKGSLSEFCKEEGLMWSMLAIWLKKDEKRNKLWREGLEARGAIRKERLMDGWWKTAVKEVVEAPTHRDVHQAREALAKAEGMPGFSNSQQVNVNGSDVTVQIVRFADGDTGPGTAPA